MIQPSLWQQVAQHISDTLGQPFTPDQQQPLGGGSINAAYCLSSGSRSYFVKWNQASQADMFIAELEGLQELAKAEAIRVPQAICTGTVHDRAYLVLEYLPLGAGKSATAQKLGEQLAQLHRYQGPAFGWHRSNTIGSTPQINTWTENWIDFYREHRLHFQIRLAARQGHGGAWIASAEQLLQRLPEFFQTYDPQPSLLHGDLWGGNYGADDQGNPVIFDPAVYYGDRETDLAMTELFGGFPPAFYQAYNTAYPLDPGYPRRKPLYQLYHLLNHLNLFGSGYLGQVQAAIHSSLR